MATLHLVSNPHALTSCLSVASSTDTLVLLEDGVYAAATLGQTGRQEAGTAKPTHWVIADDLAIRGLPSSDLGISYERLVELCTQHQPITSWC